MKGGNAANYLTQLNLHTPPFADNDDEAFFYADPERSKYLDMLQHLLQYSEEILLLTGVPGSGKSTLLEKLAARADEQWLVCHMQCSESTGADTLFSQIAACFNLQTTGDAGGMLQALQTQLDELQQQHFPVLLVDDAQNLTDDALEMVLHLAMLDGSSGKLLNLVMASGQEMVDRLGGKRFAELPQVHRLELDGMGEAHSAAYLMRRMQAAGHNGDSPFSVADLKQLHKESNGIPGQLNLAANKLLNAKYGKRLSSVGLRRMLQAGLAATALIGTVLGLQERIGAMLGNEPEAIAAPQEISSEPVVKTTTVSVEEPTVAEPEPPRVPEVAVAEPQLVVKQPAPQVEDRPLVVKKEPVAIEPITIAANSAMEEEPETATSSEALKLIGTDPETVSGGNQPLKLVLRGSGFRPGSKVALSRDGKVEVLQQDLVEFIDASKLAIEVIPGMKRSEWAVQVSTPDNRRSNVLHFAVTPPPPEEKESASSVASAEPAVSSAAVIESKPQPVKPIAAAKPQPLVKPEPAPVRATSTQGSTWLAAQPSGNYTLQLMVSESRTNISAFIQQHKLPAPLARFSMQRDGRTLHVLTYGSFADKPAALKAAANLPKGVKPWARSLADVQKVMTKESPAPQASGDAVDAAPDTAWIWSQDPTRYTIQLTAGSNEAAVMAVKQQVSLPDQLAVAKALRNGEPWFVLVYGSFPSKESARDTITRLPAILKQAGPWARSFSSLQDELTRSTPAQ